MLEWLFVLTWLDTEIKPLLHYDFKMLILKDLDIVRLNHNYSLINWTYNRWCYIFDKD